MDPHEHIIHVSTRIYEWLTGQAQSDPEILTGHDAAHKIAALFPNMGARFYQHCADVYDDAQLEQRALALS